MPLDDFFKEKIYLFILEGGRERERGRVGAEGENLQAGSPLSEEPDMGLNLMPLEIMT